LRVRSLVQPESVVLDFGAGRGSCLEDPVAFRRDIRLLRGHASRVIGVDVDESVLTNDAVDEGYVIPAGGRLPISNEAVDLIVSDHTFEHIGDPSQVSRELDRVLRPGGWICARTPNRLGYIGIGARIVPNRCHVAVLARLQPEKEARDTFPTAYRLNTPQQLRRWFPAEHYRHFVWATDSEPAYAGRSIGVARAMRLLSTFTPPQFRSVLNVFLQKRESPLLTEEG
jgi:SAM-dependent methyltransferase